MHRRWRFSVYLFAASRQSHTWRRRCLLREYLKPMPHDAEVKANKLPPSATPISDVALGKIVRGMQQAMNQSNANAKVSIAGSCRCRRGNARRRRAHCRCRCRWLACRRPPPRRRRSGSDLSPCIGRHPRRYGAPTHACTRILIGSAPPLLRIGASRSISGISARRTRTWI